MPTGATDFKGGVSTSHHFILSGDTSASGICTFLRLPVASTKPPGPILLLLDFLDAFPAGTETLFTAVKELRSVVMFSLSTIVGGFSGDGIYAIDLRDRRCRCAGAPVRLSVEAMFAGFVAGEPVVGPSIKGAGP